MIVMNFSVKSSQILGYTVSVFFNILSKYNMKREFFQDYCQMSNMTYNFTKAKCNKAENGAKTSLNKLDDVEL